MSLGVDEPDLGRIERQTSTVPELPLFPYEFHAHTITLHT